MSSFNKKVNEKKIESIINTEGTLIRQINLKLHTMTESVSMIKKIPYYIGNALISLYGVIKFLR